MGQMGSRAGGVVWSVRSPLELDEPSRTLAHVEHDIQLGAIGSEPDQRTARLVLSAGCTGSVPGRRKVRRRWGLTRSRGKADREWPRRCGCVSNSRSARPIAGPPQSRPDSHDELAVVTVSVRSEGQPGFRLLTGSEPTSSVPRRPMLQGTGRAASQPPTRRMPQTQSGRRDRGRCVGR